MYSLIFYLLILIYKQRTYKHRRRKFI